jgi:hypothetical protein
MEWKHDGSPQLKKFQTAPSARKQMPMFFWDMEGILMVGWRPHRTTVNGVIYCGILTHLCHLPYQR